MEARETVVLAQTEKIRDLKDTVCGTMQPACCCIAWHCICLFYVYKTYSQKKNDIVAQMLVLLQICMSAYLSTTSCREVLEFLILVWASAFSISAVFSPLISKIMSPACRAACSALPPSLTC